MLPLAVDVIARLEPGYLRSRFEDNSCRPGTQGMGIKGCNLFIILWRSKKTQCGIPKLIGEGQRSPVHVQLGAVFNAADQCLDQDLMSQGLPVLIFNKIDLPSECVR